MVEKLFILLDSLIEKEKEVGRVLEILNGTEDMPFLSEEVQTVELLIVKAFGGHEGHFAHIESTDLFYNYEYRKRDQDKEKLIEYIQLTIENDWTGEVEINIISG